MRKLKLFIAACALMVGAGQTWAQTDVTSTYITNPGFEENYQRFLDINTDRGVEKPVGWSVEWYQNNNDKNGMTYVAGSMTQDNKTWNAKSGKSYFARMRWGNATLYLRQTLQNLRPGNYTLSFSATAHSTNNDNSVQVSIAGQTQTIASGSVSNENGTWTDYSINFTITANTPYATIEFKADRAGDLLKVGIDNFVLNYDGSSYYSSILTNAQGLYVNNEDWAENGLSDFNDAITANSGKETIAEKNAAIVALEEAMATFKAANSVDMTAKITNPNFDNDISGWTTTGGDGNAFQRQTSAQTNFTGGFLEKWRNSWTGAYNQKNFDVSQALTNLPNGEYTVKAFILAQMQGSKETLGDNYKDKKHGGPYYIDNNNGVWFYASSGNNTANTWANSFTPDFGDTSGGILRSATVTVENGNLTIGFKGIGSEDGGTSLGTYANWIACDNWTLSYFGFDPSTLKSQISDLKEDVQDIINGDEVPTVIKTSLQYTLNNLVETPETKTILEAAIVTLQNAISAANATKDAYAEYKALKTKIEDLKNTSKYTFTGDEALSTFNSTLSTIDENAEAATEAATLTALLPSLKTAGNTFVGAIESNDGFDLTYNIENNSFETGALSPWTTNGSNDTGVRQDSNGTYTTTGVDGAYLFNTWNNGAGSKVSQTLSSLPKGYYTVTALVASDAGNTINILAGASTKGIAADATDGKTKFVEGTTDKTLVSDGSLEIGTNSSTWYKSDNFRLTYYTVKAGAAEAWAAAKAAAEAARDDAAYTNVTGSERTDLLAEIAKAEPTTAEAYGTATTALQEKTSAFIAAKDSYDALVTMRTTGGTYTTEAWPRASEAKATALADAIAAEPTDAADAVTKTNAIVTAYRQFVESNGLAEGVAVAVDYTSTYLAGADPDVNADWTDGIGTDWRSQEIYTKGNGEQGDRYYDGGWSTTAAVNINMTRELTLPDGQYQLQITARGSASLTSYTMSIGGETVNLPIEGSDAAAGTFGHGWSDKFVVFNSDGTTPLTLTIAATSTDYQQWISFNRLRLVRLDATLADDDDYNALNAAITEAKTLGFEIGEYAPYNNVAALEALAAAKAINQGVNNEQETVQAVTSALTGATWSEANTEIVNAIHNGNFATQENLGWKFSAWGEFVSGLNADTNASNGTARSSNAGTLTYGNTIGYTMPLKANSSYRLTFKVSSWDDNNKNTGTDVSVLNSEGEGLAVTSFDASGTNRNQYGAFTTYTKDFETGAAGDYTLVIKAKGNRSVYTDIKLKRSRNISIIGLANDWNTDHKMTQSTEDENVYTFTTRVNVFGNEETNYFEYKLREDGDYGVYQLPASGNTSWSATEGNGIYTLTFTADVENHNLECVAEKTGDFTFAVVGCKDDGSEMGAANELFSSTWNTATTTEVMTKKADGTYFWEKEAELETQTVKLKVVAQGLDGKVRWYGNGEANVSVTIENAGTYYFTVNFDEDAAPAVTAKAEEKATYTVVGIPGVLGSNWDVADENNNMTRNDDGTGTYTLTKKDVVLEANTKIEYKVVKNHAYANGQWGFGGNNADYNVGEAGTYHITFTFNPTTKINGDHYVNCSVIPVSVTKNITDAKYATYYSPYALDFSESGLTAYIAEQSEGKVSFTEVTNVPAYTGVLLKANTAGDYTIKTAVSSETNVDANKFIGTVNSTTAPVGSFVLLYGDKGVGFYKTKEQFTVGANTAYLPASLAQSTDGARSFISINFDDEANAIEGITAEKQMNGEIYNLQGQRVSTAKKGLYIINGKKVVMK